jgi:integrase
MPSAQGSALMQVFVNLGESGRAGIAARNNLALGIMPLMPHSTFASTAVASGQGLPMIGKLLGHTQVQTTARYAHLAADPVKSAADQVSASIAAALNKAA